MISGEHWTWLSRLLCALSRCGGDASTALWLVTGVKALDNHVRFAHIAQKRYATTWQFLPFLAIHGIVSQVLWKGGAMQSMNISLPDPLKEFVDGQIAQGRYSSASEYIRALIRADEKRKAEEQLEAKLLEGLNSEERVLTAADWKALRAEALAKLAARKHPR